MAKQRIWRCALVAQLTLVMALAGPMVVHAGTTSVNNTTTTKQIKPAEHVEKTTQVIYQFRSDDGVIHHNKKFTVKWQKNKDGKLYVPEKDKLEAQSWQMIGNYKPATFYTPRPQLDSYVPEIVYHVKYEPEDDHEGLVDPSIVHIVDEQGQNVQTQYFFGNPKDKTFKIKVPLAKGLQLANGQSDTVTFTRDKFRNVLDQTIVVKHQKQTTEKPGTKPSKTDPTSNPTKDSDKEHTKQEAGQLKDKDKQETDQTKDKDKQEAQKPSQTGKEAEQSDKTAKPSKTDSEKTPAKSESEQVSKDDQKKPSTDPSKPAEKPGNGQPDAHTVEQPQKSQDDKGHSTTDKQTEKIPEVVNPTNSTQEQEKSDQSKTKPVEHEQPTEPQRPAKGHTHHSSSSRQSGYSHSLANKGNSQLIPTNEVTNLMDQAQDKIPLGQLSTGTHRSNKSMTPVLDNEISRLSQPIQANKKDKNNRLPQTGNAGEILLTLSGFVTGLLSMLFMRRRSH